MHVQEDDIKWTDVVNKVYVDNISGALLDAQKVAAARKFEVDYCESFPVWEERPASELPPDATVVGTVVALYLRHSDEQLQPVGFLLRQSVCSPSRSALSSSVVLRLHIV